MAMRQQSTAARVFNISDVQDEIEQAMRNPQHPERRVAPLVDFTPRPMMPDYVQHREGVNQVGALSAEAVVREYEAAAKEIEAMGVELKGRLEKLEASKVDAAAVMEEIKETAARYRDEGKRIFLQIEDCALMTAEVRTTCDVLKTKIAGPSS